MQAPEEPCRCETFTEAFSASGPSVGIVRRITNPLSERSRP
jgi:hypothetical protein